MHERVFFSFTNHLQNPDKLPWNSIKNKKLFPSKLFISNKSMLLISEIFCEVLICTYYRLFFSRSIAQSFYKNLHGLFWQFISWTNWVNSGKCMDNGWYGKCLIRSHNYQSVSTYLSFREPVFRWPKFMNVLSFCCFCCFCTNLFWLASAQALR